MSIWHITAAMDGMPLDLLLWHYGHMSKPSSDNDAETGHTGGGIASAIAQDVELTIEQVEDVAKKATHAAAVALGLTKDEVPALEPSSTVPAGTDDENTPAPSSKPKA